MPAQIDDTPTIGLAAGGAITLTTCIATAEPQLAVTVYMMVSAPPLIPVTTPPLLTVAFELLALHVPPGAASLKVSVAPTHSLEAPKMLPAVRNVPMLTTFVTDVV